MLENENIIEIKQGSGSSTPEMANAGILHASLPKHSELFHALLHASNDGIIGVNSLGQILLFNPAAEKIFGVNKESMIGLFLDRLIPEMRSGQYQFNLESFFAEGHPCQGIDKTTERIAAHSDGHLFPIELSLSASRCGGEPFALAIIRDLTHSKNSERTLQNSENTREKLETQLIQTQKMESLGVLAGGIAHDFNNILGAILGYAQLAEIEVQENMSALEYIRQILTASDRAKGLVTQILAFSRQGKPEKMPVDVGVVVQEVLKLLRASLPSSIEIHVQLSPKLESVLADKTQIHQIMMNLCTNALHAMEKSGGRLHIALESTTMSVDDTPAYPDIKPGRYLKLSVTDTGGGMDAATVSRIFDPYYTTKKPGAGTGLGLATVHGIVKNHEGAIRVYSAIGAGTTFQILFPCIENQASTEVAHSKPLPTGSERVLFVDDEKALTDLGRQMLTKLGYRVESRTSPYEALELFKIKPDGYDLVITDMTMPNMSGEQFAQALLNIRANIPIIICTGFSSMMDQRRASEAGIRGFLMKPVTLNDLSRKIREVLDDR